MPDRKIQVMRTTKPTNNQPPSDVSHEPQEPQEPQESQKRGKRKPQTRQPSGYYRAIAFACTNCGISKQFSEILSHNVVGLIATTFELEPEKVAHDILKWKKEFQRYDVYRYYADNRTRTLLASDVTLDEAKTLTDDPQSRTQEWYDGYVAVD